MNIRPAQAPERAVLQRLIERSARALGAPCYTPEQIEGALAGAWGVDSQLIADGTYFVVEHAGEILACGGWSRRKTLFGGDSAAGRLPELLDPAREAARIRAFFVNPTQARQGLGKMLLEHCEDELRGEQFRAAELAATLPGFPFYRAFGYTELERLDYPLPNGATIQFVRMRKEFA